jgi:hypothetical protein
MTQRRTGRRARIAGIAAAAAVLLSAVISLSLPAQALASGVPRATSSVRVTTNMPVAPYPSTPGRVPAAVACPPFSRTQLCYLSKFVITFLVNHRPVGAAHFTVTHYLHLNPRGRDYAEQVSIGGVRLVGNAGGIQVALGDGCGITCAPTGNTFPVGATLRNGLRGTLTFHDSIGKGHEQSLRNKYEWLFLKAGFPPAVSISYTLLFYRCDEVISRVPGCVFPEYIPVMTSMRGLPGIAANIRRVQGRGRHYGRIGDKHPLHRNANEAQQTRNRNAVCSRRVVGPPPRPGVSCDEYPFASTKEGGTAVPKSSRGTEWVPVKEQNSQRGFISSFYQANRVLDGDAFWVSV